MGWRYVRGGDSEAAYLVHESVFSLSFVEPHTGDRPKKPDEPDSRHVLRNVGLQDLTLILDPKREAYPSLRSRWGEQRGGKERVGSATRR